MGPGRVRRLAMPLLASCLGFPIAAKGAADLLPTSSASGLHELLGAGSDAAAKAQIQRHVLSRARHTGTTIVGVVFDGGVILGADTRATSGRTVCDKACAKIHRLAENIFCCGAGTSADAERLTQEVQLLLQQHSRLQDSCDGGFGVSGGSLDGANALKIRVEAAHRLLKSRLYQARGAVSAALVLGGVDKTGSYLFQIHPHGSSDRVPYAALGSGSLAAMSELESRHPLSLLAVAADEGEIVSVKAAAIEEASAPGLAAATTEPSPDLGQTEQDAAMAAVAAAGTAGEALATRAESFETLAATVPADAGQTAATRLGLGLAEAKELVRLAVSAGIENDMGSGSNIDICVITRDGAAFSREAAAPPPEAAAAGAGRRPLTPLDWRGAPATVRISRQPVPVSSVAGAAAAAEAAAEDSLPQEEAADEDADGLEASISIAGLGRRKEARSRPSHKKLRRVDWAAMRLDTACGSALDDRIELL